MIEWRINLPRKCPHHEENSQNNIIHFKNRTSMTIKTFDLWMDGWMEDVDRMSFKMKSENLIQLLDHKTDISMNYKSVLNLVFNSSHIKAFYIWSPSAAVGCEMYF